MKIFRKLPSESDRLNLSLLRTDAECAQDDFDYRPYLVTKPWGFEYLFFENTHIAAWMLHLTKGHATSMHCHARKKTALVVIKGRVRCTTLDGDFPLQTGQCILLHANTFHSTQALDKDTWVMEIETPVNKSDLVRLKDSYGRVGEGYEDITKYKHLKDFPEYLQLSMQRPELTFMNVRFALHENPKSSLDAHELLALVSFPEKENLVTAKNYLLRPVGEVFEQESFEKFKDPLLSVQHTPASFLSLQW